MSSVKVIAHRGAFKSKNLPENSVAALREAARLNCFGCEFDVHSLSDGGLIVYHDDMLNSTPVSEISSKELKNLLCFGVPAIPSLNNYLTAALSAYNLHLFLEIKKSGSQKKTLEAAENCLKTIQDFGLKERTHFISFDFEAGRYLAAKDCRVSYLGEDLSPEEIKAAGFIGINYHFSVYREHPERIQSARDLGMTVNSWTVNSEDDMLFLIREGVDFITTDEPELLLSLLNHFK